jgi:hypothetical protein
MPKTLWHFSYGIYDAGHRIAVSLEDVQPGTVVRILRLNTVIPCLSR